MGPDVNLLRKNISKQVQSVLSSPSNSLPHFWRVGKMKIILSISVFLIICFLYRSPVYSFYHGSSTSLKWTWVCDPIQQTCLKLRLNSSLELQSENKCKVTCAPQDNLWPLPNNYHIPGQKSAIFNAQAVTKNIQAPDQEVEQFVSEAVDFQLSKLKPSKLHSSSSVQSQISVSVMTSSLEIDIDTNEKYDLRIICDADSTKIEILAETYFGARHALETLFQLILFDNINEAFVVSCDIEISDEPFYKHRGVMLDTARNFISVDMIKTLIDSMSYSKMNVFHWHVTDSQSFPLYLESLPMMAESGAYSMEQTYNKWEVDEIVRHATKRGVRVLPEFDSPAHVGAGWDALDPEFTLCVNKEPWEEWCVEPPCGQLNPTQEGMYDVLETIYRDMLKMFGVKQFHLGGDEIHLGCWNSSFDITKWLEDRGRGREEKDFMYLWSYYLEQTVDRIKRAGMEVPKLVYWTNGLTKPDFIKYLDPKIFSVQIWSSGNDFSDATIKTVAENGFKMIFSNYDATYLDCGFGGWVAAGNNWCSPYKEWQLQHQNDPIRLLEMRGLINLEEAKSNILGGEVALWTEQSDGHNMMNKIEPRASAYAERLWKGPKTGSWLEAERRLVRHRERLVRRGIGAETMTHGWCRQNEGKCILRDNLNAETFFGK